MKCNGSSSGDEKLEYLMITAVKFEEVKKIVDVNIIRLGRCKFLLEQFWAFWSSLGGEGGLGLAPTQRTHP